MNSNDIVYSAIKLSDTTHLYLLKLFKPLFENISADHITLKFGKQQIPEFLGTNVYMRLLRYVYDLNCQTVECEILSDKIKSENFHAHITISYNNKVSATYSNNLLNQNVSYSTEVKIYPAEEIIIEGRIEVFCKDNTWKY